jgi:GntR family transcriptional repressor for pyruvate dehydrogenase complex
VTGPTSSRTPVSAALFDDLRAAILLGRLSPDDALPGERALAEEHGVNRHAVREAVKRLQQSGLVEVTHGGATRVLDWRRSGGLDLLATLASSDDAGAVAPAVLPAILEMRACIGVDVAGRCAERADDALLRGLPARLAAVVATPPQDLEAREETYAALWADLVDGAENLAYRLAFNSLVAGVGAIGAPALGLLAHELGDDDGHRTLVDAVVRRDAPAAEIAARALLTVL